MTTYHDPAPTGPTWDITAALDGYAVWFWGEVVASEPTFDEARATYNVLRAHAAMARESLRHALRVSAR